MIALRKFGTPSRDDDEEQAPVLLNYQIRMGSALICLETEEGSEQGESSAYESWGFIGSCHVDIDFIQGVVTSRNMDVFPVISGMVYSAC